jgi:hypothetical protein
MGRPLMAVHCRPWTSAVLELKLEVGLLAVISTAWLSLADPKLSLHAETLSARADGRGCQASAMHAV